MALPVRSGEAAAEDVRPCPPLILPLEQCAAAAFVAPALPRLLGAAIEDDAIAFDAIGGGKQGSQILTAMEIAASRKAGAYSRYGSTTHKQLYIYGGLDRGPTVLNRTFGFAWGVGGWLLTPFLIKIGAEAAQKLRERVASEVKTTFASTYSKQVSLAGALEPETIAVYGRQATGSKYLITP